MIHPPARPRLPTRRGPPGIFYDAKAKRIYVSGGAGAIRVFAQKDANRYVLLGDVSTAEGARTSLFVSESRKLYVAAPRQDLRAWYFASAFVSPQPEPQARFL